MSKQDRTQSRTPADTERKFLLNLEKSFAEIIGIATDARTKAEKTNEDLSAEIARLDVKIQETADGIILSVEDVYATNESVASAIEVMRGNILLSVSETYETQENANTKRAEMQLTIDEQGASIEGQAKLINDNKQNLASLQVKVAENSASITQQASLISENKSSIASTNTKVDENTASIKNQASLISENTASIGTLAVEVDENSANIAAQAQLIEGNTTNIGTLSARVDEHSSTIQAQAATITEHTTNIASLNAKTDEQGASIELLVDDNGVKGSVIVEAINGQSSAKISADKLDIEGKELNIKVKSTNIEGDINADQINADGLNVQEAVIGGWDLGLKEIPLSDTVTITANALESGWLEQQGLNGVEYTYKTWLTPQGVYVQYHEGGYLDGINNPKITVMKTWFDIICGT